VAKSVATKSSDDDSPAKTDVTPNHANAASPIHASRKNQKSSIKRQPWACPRKFASWHPLQFPRKINGQ
jgi:hypothetical protein